MTNRELEILFDKYHDFLFRDHTVLGEEEEKKKQSKKRSKIIYSRFSTCLQTLSYNVI